jgi:hypothetical protein
MKFHSIPTNITCLFSLIFLSFLSISAQAQKPEEQRTMAINQSADPTVSLVYADTLIIPSFYSFELPVTIKSSYSISAISLGFNFPKEYLELDSIVLINGTPGAYYNITDSSFKLAWSDLNPINVASGDHIITLIMNSLDLSTLSNTIKLELDGLSEFADIEANVIEGVILEISEIEFLKPDPGDSIAGNYVNIYPNPFRDQTKIYLTLKSESQVRVTIFNTAGIGIKLFEEKTYPEGNHIITINSLDLAQGVYLLKIEIKNPEASGEKLFKLLNCK